MKIIKESKLLVKSFSRFYSKHLYYLYFFHFFGLYQQKIKLFDFFKCMFYEHVCFVNIYVDI